MKILRMYKDCLNCECSCGKIVTVEAKACVKDMLGYSLIKPIFCPRCKVKHEALYPYQYTEDYSSCTAAEDGIQESNFSSSPSIHREKENGNEARCPNCMSTSIHVDRKGFGWGKAAVGGFMLGPLGLLAGGIGSKKVQMRCISCGYKWD